MIDLENIKNSKGLKFCHLNIRSLIGKLDLFKLHFENAGFDVITLSETWLTRDISSAILEMPNYQMFRCDRGQIGERGHIKKGGGLMIYVKKHLNYMYIHDDKNNSSELDGEIQRLELRGANQKNIIIFNVYRPPNGSVEAFINSLSERVMEENEASNCELMFMGDFNINYKARASPDRKKLLVWQNKCGLTQLVKTETRCMKNTKTIIDLIFTNIEHCQAAGVIDLHMSDHQPVYVIKKKVRKNRGRTTFSGRTYVNYTAHGSCGGRTDKRCDAAPTSGKGWTWGDLARPWEDIE